MGQGTAGGIRDQAGAVQDAAEQALVPRPPRGGRAQGAASGGVVVNHLEVHAPHVFDEGGLAEAELHFQSALRINRDDTIARDGLETIARRRAGGAVP